jgi:hypothetical protein
METRTTSTREYGIILGSSCGSWKHCILLSRGLNVYSYTVPGNKWTKLPECGYFALAAINDAQTTVGGENWLVLMETLPVIASGVTDNVL